MDKTIYIITSNFMLRYFRKIDIFTLELGFANKQLNNKPGETPKIKIKDKFSKEYENMTSRLISRYGSIGTIVFYEDNSIDRYEIHVHKNDSIYEISVTLDDIKQDAKKYLIDTLKSIDNIITEKEQIKNIVYTNMPEEFSAPDERLPKEQYIEALVKRREILEKMKNS